MERGRGGRSGSSSGRRRCGSDDGQSEGECERQSMLEEDRGGKGVGMTLLILAIQSLNTQLQQAGGEDKVSEGGGGRLRAGRARLRAQSKAHAKDGRGRWRQGSARACCCSVVPKSHAKH